MSRMRSHIAKTGKHGNERHGQARRGNKTATYKTWESMIRRCTMPSQDSYRLYGARGIRVCERWRAFENFRSDMGEQPDGLSLDRINSDGNYEPGNCRWADKVTQSQNRRTARLISHDGKTMALSAWAQHIGIASRTLRERLVTYGWSVERALTTPAMTYAESSKLARTAQGK